ncbi:Sec-independent protein translocase protein TatB [Pararhodobacter zhoushanensis]|uniref:Sec-independent protein translocase protein TatB n=1 Tax=Pararhodobacter zhoushanensis TaxID=2479545 RepID=UPI000F8F780D|nr:Sec-independent protein translocase protein TatB [Pararhodobacter zhoushanensis]
MLDIGWSEMLVVGVVALIVVGPKDLPKMFHTLGEITGKAKGMAREFQRAMDVAAKETGVNDLVKDFKRTTSGASIKEAAGFDDIEKEFRDIGRTGKPAAQTKANAKPGMTPIEVAPVAKPVDVEPDEASADEVEAQSHDADLAARNAAASATEAERIKRAKKAEAARLKAAELRAQRDAEAAAAAPARPEPSSEPEPSSKTES